MQIRRIIYIFHGSPLSALSSQRSPVPERSPILLQGVGPASAKGRNKPFFFKKNLIESRP